MLKKVAEVKCEYTLVCTVIDGRNVSTILQCVRNLSTMLTMPVVFTLW